MARIPEGPPPPPAVQKLRVRYAKRGRLRFSSTRDFQRALERALRRAGVPMAFSAGFHPHPKVSYANAAPTGTASEAEYFEISVTERVDPESLRVALDEALPAGPRRPRGGRGAPGALADRLQASDWLMEFAGVDARRCSAPPTSSGAGAGRGDADVQDRSADLRREICHRVAGRQHVCGGRTVRYCGWSYGTPHRLYAPTTS